MEKMWVNIRINLYLSTENSNVAVFWRCGQTPEKRTWSCDLASSDNGSCGPRSLRVERAADREAFGWNGPTDREAFGWNGLDRKALRAAKPSGGTVQQIAKPSGGTVCGSESLRVERSNGSRSLRVERSAGRKAFGWNGPEDRKAFGWNGQRGVRSTLRGTLHGLRVRAPGVSFFVPSPSRPHSPLKNKKARPGASPGLIKPEKCAGPRRSGLQ